MNTLNRLSDIGSVAYLPVGACIYCGAVNACLRDEHIVPYGLGGRWRLPRASCTGCAAITRAFEQDCEGAMLRPTGTGWPAPLAMKDEPSFARMLAKIGHAQAVANLGISSFKPLLTDLILGMSGDAASLLGVGHGRQTVDGSSGELHRISLRYAMTSQACYLVADIQLFARAGMPRYEVVVGEASTEETGTVTAFWNPWSGRRRRPESGAADSSAT